jgi:hypothetical protein
MDEEISMKYALMAALVFCVALPPALQAQAKTDFSGTWTFDEAKSDPAPARAGGGGGGGGGRGGGRMGGAPPTAMTIKQTPAELSMDRTTAQGAQTVVYKLDGSESTNTIGMGPATSKAVWDGARLVITTTQTVQGRGGEITINSKEIYSVQGPTLTIETTRTTPGGEQTRKLIYTKG